MLLSSTGATQPIITAARFQRLLRRRRSRPIFIIDLALPRDIEPEVGSLPNVYLYNLDHLQEVVDQTRGQRTEQVAHCEKILLEAVSACMAEVQNRDIGQLIRALRNACTSSPASSRSAPPASSTASSIPPRSKPCSRSTRTVWSTRSSTCRSPSSTAANPTPRSAFTRPRLRQLTNLDDSLPESTEPSEVLEERETEPPTPLCRVPTNQPGVNEPSSRMAFRWTAIVGGVLFL